MRCYFQIICEGREGLRAGRVKIMNLDPLEAEVMGWLLDDCDTPRSLAGGIAQEFGRSATEYSVSKALSRLVALGLAQTYEYDLAANSFRPIALTASPLTAWFMVTQAGRDAGDRTD